MNQQLPTTKLSLLHVLLIAGVSLITFFLLFSPVGDVGIFLKLNKFDSWYYNGLAPCIQAFVCTLIGELTSRRHYLGAWIAGGAVLLVFGGMDILFRNVDPTDPTLQSLEFTTLGVVLGIIALYAWRFMTKRKTL
jgi:hypothetical protein